MITLKCLNKKDLEEFVLSETYQSFDFLPITKHRALSQIKNPNATEDDILLTIALQEGKLAGYLGTFPDQLTVESNKIKFAWLSTLYVSENFRGKKIAQQLLSKVFEKYNDKIAITEFTKEAESLYNKTQKFDYIIPKKGKRYYFRTNFEELLPLKKPSLSALKPVFKSIDFSTDLFLKAAKIINKPKKTNFEIAELVDEESAKFIEKFHHYRDGGEINMIIKNPWVLQEHQANPDYIFSSYAKEFNYFWIKIYDHQKNLKTCALLQLRDQHLKIPYLFSENKLENFKEFLQYFIKEKNIKTLTSFNENLNEALISKNSFGIYSKNFERRYLFHKELLANLPKNFNPKFQDGDGDPIFT